ncbi:NAD-glutamate dehydrogenase domain-containing protein [Alteriqipengyuania sp. WL0013]|uniref:NAD-glutamate dehydrogenase n=1 Tax=Alteriqipengyuania sp. WL0013 TaxID=3110773 RepID=UPI002C8FD641|nr:NAD-glutamate dehydrogenase domain-containing protein [Alteriqipengyuania sp. WL0013]MEB3416465.1 NAD-glutamate dehydrogenase domain-containing protein [Alteriqipengyuania sp. WL0013]
MGKGRTKRTDDVPGKLVDALGKQISASLLLGDPAFPPSARKDAAAFLLAAAAGRKPGKHNITLESASEERRFMRIAIINDDMPFLVDSVAAAIAEHGLTIDRLVHPVVRVSRDEGGAIDGISAYDRRENGNGAAAESMIYVECSRADARQRRALCEHLAETLDDVHAAVKDWPKLRAAMQRDAAALDGCKGEGAELMRWLDDGNLTQLGHIIHQRGGETKAPLGICRASASPLLAPESIERAFAWFADRDACEAAPLAIKANRISNVHRPVPLDLFIVPLFADDGTTVTALSIHAGVWTSAALTTRPQNVPRMRAQLEALTGKLGFDPQGHAGKSLVHSLTTLPHDLVIGFTDKDVERVATTMMRLVDRPRPRLALVEAPLARHLFVFVWLPRDLLSTAVRNQAQTLVSEAANGKLLDWSLEVDGGQLATLRFVLDIREGGSVPDAAKLEEELEVMLRGWGEAVERELGKTEEAGRAAAIAGRFAESFPQGYRLRNTAAEAARDITALRTLDGKSASKSEGAPDRGVRLYRKDDDADGSLRLKVYQQSGSLPLSDAVPALENFGFRVLEEVPTLLDRGKLGTIHDFHLDLGAQQDTDALLDRAGDIEAAIAAVLNGEAEDDAFNVLVTTTGISAAATGWMRAFYRYLRQTGMTFVIYTVVGALRGAPQVTHALIDLIHALHDPDFKGDREEAAADARRAIRTGLSRVQAINDDRLLRLYRDTIMAMLRTNIFAPAAAEALAFKFDSAKVPGLPKPLPWREIFVYSRRVEGIHLRAGPVARGGLRWSDRRDDFRTEILGLMKAQRVKNAVIVPTGAKGGFYPKQLPDPAQDRDGWAAEGQASYEVFIRTLLSITDDLDGDKVIHPERVVIRDGDDPYFVVAADKGTARFSDVANAIAEDRDFWLGDAFASGGSNGYDHKAMGITAKGAWISVQRHFLEMGVDVQSDPVRVIGCGDMSGDVFGNGMLLSKAIKLVAAFDHRHIFIDPDPDPAKSWKERKRLFDLPRSSWDDYDNDLISKGGGVFPRDAKQIKLTAAMRKLLDVEDKAMEPEALISAILKSPTDLLWFGGIGTYVKASAENNAAVGDPANDPIRVNGDDLRVKVIGEGANLGVTQAGRIEFALGGGAINTDFIDNSAGVDCSDNEVNIKIALAAAKRAGKLSEPKRVKLLEEMTDEVSALVLEDNRLQALALSIAGIGGANATGSQLHLIETLEDGGNLDRRTEGLADNQALQRRASDGRGLTRPELAVLLSSAKLVLQGAIEASDLPDDPVLHDLLLRSFPEPMRKGFKTQIENHRLRREIIATKLANAMVNRLGIVHPFELAEEEGVELAQVAASFVAVAHLFNLRDLWAELDTAKMEESARLFLFDRLAAASANLMSDVLRTAAGRVRPAAMVKELGKSVDVLASDTEQLLGRELKAQSARLRQRFTEAGASDAMAAQVSRMFEFDGAVGLAQLASDSDIPARQITHGFTEIGSALGIDWAQSTAATMNPSDVWERLLVSGLARDFQQMRFEFLRRLSRRKGAKEDPQGAVENWVEQNEEAIRQFRSMITRAQNSVGVAPAMLAQIASQARNLLQR